MTALLAALALGAALADAPPAASSAQTLEQVQVTATRRPESTLEVPAATTVIGRERIREAAAQSAMDLLHGETGTFVQQTTPGQAVVIVRGLKGSEVLHLVDGFRLNNAIFRNAPNQYIALVDGQAIARIEVVRGPSSALYGGDAMGGVVQMFTAEPEIKGEAWSAAGRLRSLYGSADHSTLTRFEGHGGRAGLVASGGVTYQDVGELRTGSGGRQPFTAYTARAADAKLRFEPADEHEIMLAAQFLEQPHTPRYDELVPGYGQTAPNSSEFAFQPQIRRFAHARYRSYAANALWDTLEAHLGRQIIVDDRRSRDFGAARRDLERNSSTLDGVTLQAGKAIGEHYLTYGAELYRDEVRSRRLGERVDDGLRTERASRFPDGSTMRQAGAFLVDDWRVGRLDVNGGLRYSRISSELPSNGGIGTALSDSDLSGNVGLAFALAPQTRLVANLGRGFRPPNVFDLGTFGDRPGNRFNIPNPELAPERVATIDAGIKFAGRRWQGEAIAFRSRYRDKITPVLTGETTDTGRAIVQSRNATRLDLWGIETGVRAHLRDDLELYASATATRGDEQLEGDEYPADRIPPLFGKAGAVWHPRPKLSLEGYVFYAAKQDRLSPRDRIDPRMDPNGTSGWSTLNARFAYRVRDDLDLSLRLDNLGDHAYREHGSGLDEPGFNAILGVDWRF